MSSHVDVDVAIVGAGVIGCMIAREIMIRSPGATVVMLDRDAVGSGATRRSAGLHLPRGGSERVRQMSAYSQDYYLKLRRDDTSLPIREIGMTVLTASDESYVREVYLDQARLTPVVRLPDGRVQIRARAFSGEGCQYADVYGLTQALAARLRPTVGIREGIEVIGIEIQPGRAVLRLGSGQTLNACQAVLAPGPWIAAPAWKDLIGPTVTRVKRIVALHIEVAPAADDQVMVFHDEDAFLLPLPHRGHWLFSYTCPEWDVDPDSSGTLSGRHLAQGNEILHRYAPAFVDACASGRVFCDAYSPTAEPQVHALDGEERIIFAGTASGSGYRLAPSIAAQATDLLHLTGRTP